MQHSRQQLEADLEQQKRALRHTTDPGRARIFQRTIHTIERLLQGVPEPSEVRVANPIAPNAAEPVRAASVEFRPPTPQAQSQRKIRLQNHLARHAPKPEGGVSLTISATNVGATALTIAWEINGQQETEVLTEGECRGKFVTALRDVLESARWRQGRFEDVKKGLTWLRAQGYYNALCICWKRAPTMSDLRMNHSRFFEVFQMLERGNESAA